METILYVDDLVRAVAFYRGELGLEPMAGDPARFQSFKVGGRQVLLLFRRGGTLTPTTVPGGIIPPHDGTGPVHIGLAITHDAYDSWLAHLRRRGIAIESETTWPRGGRSLYFSDPDGHLLGAGHARHLAELPRAVAESCCSGVVWPPLRRARGAPPPESGSGFAEQIVAYMPLLAVAEPP